MTIYEITNELQAIIEELQNNGGELTAELEEALFINRDEFKNKCEGYCKARANLEGQVVAANNEKERIEAYIIRTEKAIDRIDEVLKNAMQIYEMPKVEAGTFRLSLRTNKSVNISSEEDIPSEYIKRKEVVSIDKAGIRKMLLSGEQINGAELKETQSLIIK